MIDENIFGLKIAELDEIIGTPLSNTSVTTYYRILSKNMNTDEFIEVVDKLLESWSYSYYPKPAHFLELLKLDDDTLEDISTKASITFANAIESVGKYSVPEFEDKTISYVIDKFLGGWVECCKVENYDKLYWLKDNFKKHYKRVVKNGVTSNELGDVKLLDYYKNEEPRKVKVKSDYKVPLLVKKNESVLLDNKVNNTIKNKLQMSYKRI